MNLLVAGKPKQYAEGLTVKQLIEQEQVKTPEYVTVSVNDAFVSSGDFETKALSDGDTVEFLYFMGGGCI